MRVFNETLTSNTLLNADNFSVAVPLKSIFMYSLVATVSGVPTGVFTLEASNDPETNTSVPLPPPANWVKIEGSDVTQTTQGRIFWNVHEVAYNYVRLVFKDASGGASTAKMSVVFNGKGA